jgi:hypothetical protein
MEQKIAKLLEEAVHPADLLAQIATGFYETIEENRAMHRVLALMLNEYETFEDYFQAANEDLSDTDHEILLGIQEDCIYQVENYFNKKEDEILQGLQGGHWAEEILADMRSRGIVPISEKLTEDDIGSVYAEAFENFDQMHLRFVEKLMTLSPLDAYQQGEKAEEDYRRKHRIVFDERDFIEVYMSSFSKEGLWKLLTDRLKETFQYGRHYELVSDADEEDEEESPDGTSGDEEEITVLEGREDLSPDMFEYVYELMQEYTGRRILPSENEFSEEAYWTTYQDDFQELLAFYLLDHLEVTMQTMEEERTREYENFSRLYNLTKEQRMDPEQILTHCDRINYFLTQLNEELWVEFTETKVKDLL